MLLIILAICWILVFTPSLFRRFRERDANHSIKNFQAGMESLGHRGEAAVQSAYLGHERPAYYDEPPAPAPEPLPRLPRLRLVEPDATAATLARSMSWEEWSESMADDPYERVSSGMGSSLADDRYEDPYEAARPISPAAAYSRPIQAAAPHVAFETGKSVRKKVDPRRRRRRIFLFLLVSSVGDTLWMLGTEIRPVIYSTIGLWATLVLYLTLMFIAMQRGMIRADSYDRESSGYLGDVTRVHQVPVPERYNETTAESEEWRRASRYAAGQ